ncbi:MAG: GCN5-related N-acetyltransferase, FIGfam019367 [uncultured Frankineae bacterium]|uniref:GCN5-related N-acetyltransferase, FIGfam019367 n=1 Tax=uncultured Frankineae bacterium TaxID=437475 RepID=A0A6J4MGZ8_9ACTN|nr:MAG: GCN5-related N-acetyltransferase, FIGfam019367 [uncultured Frankineae bacterium]
MLRTASAARVLDRRDTDEVLALLERDPVADVFVASRIHSAGLTESRLGAQVWGFGERGRLESLCYSGANLVPVQAGPEAVRAFADRARRQGRRCSSIVGESAAVCSLWQLLTPSWGRARAVRARQPLLVLDGPPAVAPDPGVRAVRREEVDTLLPACIAMFTEEIGVSPLVGDGGTLYRARVTELVTAGRAFARIDDGRVVFKAEVGAATTTVCQVQGVWVAPELRGQGLSVAGTAAAAVLARARIAPVVSLYVNDFNTAARRAYERVGFRQVGTFTSVLF